MLRTVKVILETVSTQAQARKALKVALSLTTAKGYVPCDETLILAVAKDMGGTAQLMQTPDGATIGMIKHTLKAADIKNVKADMSAFLDSEELAELPTSQPKAKKEIVKADELHTQLMSMSAGDFGRFAEQRGIKATIDRGVWSLTIPGVRGSVYFDAQTGEQLAVGEKGDNLKVTLDSRKAEGKLKALAFLVTNKRAKLTAKQIEHVNDCAMSDFDIPQALQQFVNVLK